MTSIPRRLAQALEQLGSPLAKEERAALDENYRRDRERLGSERDSKIAKLRAGGSG